MAAGRYGSRIRVVVYGAAAGNGTRLMRTYDTFNAANFVRYLGLARKKWGRVMLIMDNAPRHKSSKVRRYLERTPDVMLLYLPVARPELSAVEEVRGQAKYRLVTPGFRDAGRAEGRRPGALQDLRDQGRHLQVPHAQRVRRDLHRTPV